MSASGYHSLGAFHKDDKAAWAQTVGDFGRIDFLVNNAGGQFGSPLEKISAKGFDAVVRTNLTGGFLMARETYAQWMKQHGGAIVNMIADMWNGMPGMGHSGAARAGMLNLRSRRTRPRHRRTCGATPRRSPESCRPGSPWRRRS